MTQAFDFLVDKNNIETFEVHPALVDQTHTLQDGEILFKVQSFAFTANNITYAAFGNSHLKYWDFFPASDNWGRIPVWGFADVVASKVGGISVGERFYGYYPMSSYLVVQPAKVSAAGFMDAANHRSHLSPIYNYYMRSSSDPAYSPDLENLQSLFRPLFMTSFLIEDFLQDNDYFGADCIILSSASSKTALGAAFQIYHNRANGSPRVIGLTSASNIDFVHSLGCYDQVLSYDDIAQLDAAQKAVFVDMAGSGQIRAKIHNHFGNNLTYSCSVGASHWDTDRSVDNLPGPAPTLFFAPAQAQKRTQEWGQDKFMKVSGAAWARFIKDATSWIEIEECSGTDKLSTLYKDMIAGSINPKVGHIFKP
ncbi:hypothetical protein GCM10017044_27350 [Kordiimonas sediminis]|uniref:DUF2855 family protein n=1 Tax=Kordiimonas sediminis TaxID=1735581 RepID=A0A919EAL4_9PROT|nr:DUF2855 family protein [Kordiimonas sediminis]GHF30499.1 hypothetical protein GCM10017044_27350 [Kordiimonas sediminis]